ncbi:hypothetical protein H5T51_00190 [Candidatus Bathyarchaeota archaeon]|nr:hypothetical protein [Candidatus Bathyarchaeota archaeon]
MDTEWEGLDGNGAYDFVLLIGLPYHMGLEVMSALKHFASHITTVNLDNMYNPQANWSLPNLSVEEWVNTLMSIVSQLKEMKVRYVCSKTSQ